MKLIDQVVYVDYETYQSITPSPDILYLVDQNTLLDLYQGGHKVANVIHVASQTDLPVIGENFVPECFYVVGDRTVQYAYEDRKTGQQYYFQVFDDSLESIDLVSDQVVLKSYNFPGQQFTVLSLTDDGILAPETVDTQVQNAINNMYDPRPIWRSWDWKGWNP